MADELKALPTIWNGITFRSRAEARWAVLFETAGIAWEYEKEGYDVNGRWYLPDFYLPAFPMWFEVKPNVEPEVLTHFADLCRLSHKRGIIAWGPPTPKVAILQVFGTSGRLRKDPYALLADRRNEGEFWLSSDTEWFSIGPVDGPDHGKAPLITGALERAFEAAQAERFGT
jgi:hypothetical protein